MSSFLRTHGLYISWISPGQNIGVGSCSLLQGIFPTQGLNPGLLHCRWIGVGCYFLVQRIFLTQIKPLSPMSPTLAGRSFTTSATWEALYK